MKLKCDNCSLCENGIENIYEGENAKYLIVSESPKNGKHLLLPNMSDFWLLLLKNGFKKSEFKIGYSIFCYNEHRPSEYHREMCIDNIKMLLQSFNPKMILILGNFALHTLTGKWGIQKIEDKIEKRIIFKKEYEVMYWQNQNTMLHSDNIETSVRKFKQYIG